MHRRLWSMDRYDRYVGYRTVCQFQKSLFVWLHRLCVVARLFVWLHFLCLSPNISLPATFLIGDLCDIASEGCFENLLWNISASVHQIFKDLVSSPILNPILNWILNQILNQILNWILNRILNHKLNPILNLLLNPIFKLILKLILNWISKNCT